MGKPSQCSEMEDGEKRWVVWWKVVRRLPDERGFLPRPLGVARARQNPQRGAGTALTWPARVTRVRSLGFVSPKINLLVPSSPWEAA